MRETWLMLLLALPPLPEPDVSLSDFDRLPPPEVVRRQVAWADEQVDRYERLTTVCPHRCREYRRRIALIRKAREPWWVLHVAQEDFSHSCGFDVMPHIVDNTRSYALLGLADLQHRVGVRAYLWGRLPPAVPPELFEDVDR